VRDKPAELLGNKHREERVIRHKYSRGVDWLDVCWLQCAEWRYGRQISRHRNCPPHAGDICHSTDFECVEAERPIGPLHTAPHAPYGKYPDLIV